MSIHKSKGLEFPFVFLCGSASGHNTREENPPLEKHSEFGIALRYQNRDNLKKFVTFPEAAIRLINKNELRAERLRLLYVALTRAEERLFITASRDVFDKSEELAPLLSLPESARGYVFSRNDSLFLWIISALKISGGKCFEVFSVCPEEKADSAVFETAEPPKEAVEALTRTLTDSKTAAESENSRFAARLSVTEINALRSPAVYPLRSAVPESGASRDTAAGRGTAIHRFMQYADFKNAFVSVGAETERLIKTGVLSKRDASLLDFSKLQAFFHSDFFERRLINAKSKRREIEIYAKISDIPLDEKVKIEYNISGDSFLQGVADLVFEEEDGYILLDYKTNRRYALEKAEFTEHLRELYALQLSLYAAALEVITGKKIKEKFIWAFDIGELINII
jgi:ATP-dependent helicase/nuclease subunit A